MAPIEQYLMDRDAEIALARSAAPESISRDAEILILGRHGFETTVKGKNGFVCIMERSWTSAPADPDFWNPKVRTPICYNAAAARSFLPRNLKRTDLILAGRTKGQVDETIVGAGDKKELPAIESGAMCYMMSKQGYGGDSVKHWPPHLRSGRSFFSQAVFSVQSSVAVAAHLPSLFRSCPPLVESRKRCRTSAPDAAPEAA